MLMQMYWTAFWDWNLRWAESFQFFFYWFIDGDDDNENRHGTQLKLIKFQTKCSISMEILSKEIKKVVFKEMTICITHKELIISASLIPMEINLIWFFGWDFHKGIFSGFVFWFQARNFPWLHFPFWTLHSKSYQRLPINIWSSVKDISCGFWNGSNESKSKNKKNIPNSKLLQIW